MFKRIQKALKSGGFFVCEFHWITRMGPHLKLSSSERLLLSSLWATFGMKKEICFGVMLSLSMPFLRRVNSGPSLNKEDLKLSISISLKE